MAHCRLRVAVTATVVALAVAGCAQDDAAPEVDPADASLLSDEGDAAEASGVEGPGADDPVDRPTLSLPGLPIGGETYFSIDGNHPDNQCANVNWIVEADAADLAPGVEVTVTGFEFDPAVFTVATAGCDDNAPPCPGFTYTVDAQACNLAVAPIPGSDTSLDSYRFSLLGRVDCRELGSERCEAFRAAVAAEPKLSLGLDPPVIRTTADDSEVPGDDGTDAVETETETETDGAATQEPDTGATEGSDTGADTSSGSDG